MSISVKELYKDIKKQGAVHIVVPGPSGRRLFYNFNNAPIISVNFGLSSKAKYEWLCDPLPSSCKIAMYPDIIKVPKVGIPVPVTHMHCSDGSPSDLLFKDGAINNYYPTCAKAVILAVLHGAKKIYLWGYDYCNPYSNLIKGEDILAEIEKKTQSVMRFMTKRYLKSLARRHIALEKCISLLDEELTVYNLSPFSNIKGTKRICETSVQPQLYSVY